MIGFVLRKMAASVGRSAATEIRREGEGEMERAGGWVGGEGERSDFSTSLTGQRQLIGVLIYYRRRSLKPQCAAGPDVSADNSLLYTPLKEMTTTCDLNTNGCKHTLNRTRMVHSQEA